MPSDDLLHKLQHAEKELSELRAKLSHFQKDVDRKEKRLAKATSRSTKLEGLLMQTEHEAAQLRAKCSETEAAVENAKRVEGELLHKLQDTSARLSDERDALARKADLLAQELDHKMALIGELQTQVTDAQKSLREREEHLVAAREQQHAKERDVMDTLSDKEQLVSSLRSQLEEAQRAHQTQLAQVSQQRDTHLKLLSERERVCATLQTKLEDSTLATYNLQLRLKESHHDAEIQCRKLQAALSSKQDDVSDLEEQLTSKVNAIESLKSEASNLQTALDQRNCALSETVEKLKCSESAFQAHQENFRNLTAKADNENTKLQEALKAKTEELSMTKEKFTAESTASERALLELSRKQEAIQACLADAQLEKEEISSRLEASQQALQAVQRSLSETAAASSQRLHSLEQQLAEKQNDLESTSSAVKEQSSEYQLKLDTLSEKLKFSADDIAAKDEVISKLQEKILQSEKSLSTLKHQMEEFASQQTSREQELQNLVDEKNVELEALNSRFVKSSEDFNALQTAYEEAKSNLEDAETNAKNETAALQSQLDSAVQKSNDISSECTGLHDRLADTEKRCKDQSTEIEKLQIAVREYESNQVEHHREMKAIVEEKAQWSRKSLEHQEQMRVNEVEKAEVLKSLKAIYSERDELSACLEALQKMSAESILEAQEAAVDELADLSLANELLRDQLEEHQKESETAVERMRSLELELAESMKMVDESGKQSRKQLDEISNLDASRVAAETRVRAAEEVVEQLRSELVKITEESKSQETLLTQEVKLKDSVLQSKDALLKQMRVDLDRSESKAKDLETANLKMKSAISNSDILLRQASAENEKLVEVLTSSQAEFEKTLDSTANMLKTSQKSEQISKSAYRLLFDRLRDLRTAFGLDATEEDQSNPSDMHSEANAIIAQLEEYFHGGKHVLEEFANLSEQVKQEQKSNEELKGDNERLQSSLNNVEGKLQSATEELNAFTSSGLEKKKELSLLEEKLCAFEKDIRTLEREKADLEEDIKQCNRELAAKNEEIGLVSAREEKATRLNQELREIANAATDNLEQHERAAEVALISVQRRHKELEDEVSKAEDELKEVSEKLQSVSRERDAVVGKLKGLEDTHQAVLCSQEEVNQQHQNKIEEMEAELNSSAEVRQSQETSLLHALEEARAHTELAEDRCRTIEQEKNELQSKVDEADGLRTEKCEAEFSLKETELKLKGQSAEVQRLMRELSSLEAEMHKLREKHLAEKDEARVLFEKKFQEASANEDDKARSLNLELETAINASESLGEQVTVLREELQSVKSKNVAEVAAIERRFEAAKNAHELVEKQKEEAEEELAQRTKANNELADTVDELQQQLAEKVRSAALLTEKLGAAEVSIAALETKVKLAEEMAMTTSHAHDAAIDELLQKLESTRNDLEITVQSEKDSSRIAERRLSEIERLEQTVAQLQEDVNCAKAEVVNLEALLTTNAEDIASTKRTAADERNALQRKCDELSTVQTSNQVELDTLRFELAETKEKLEDAQNRLVGFGDNVSQLHGEKGLLQKALNRHEAEIDELKAVSRTSTEQLESKTDLLEKAQATVTKLSQDIEVLRHDKGTAASTDTIELERMNTELQRRGERLGVRSKKLLRRLKRAEKLLAVEKRKSHSAHEESVKRQVSPSAKGMSPAMKRIREQERREPFSPIASNARPPQAPKASTKIRNIAF